MDEKKETGRVEAFSDGVFAVAITLLVLNLKLPSDLHIVINADDNIWNYLGGQWAPLLAFVTSFANIGVMWINHHRVFTHIRRADNNLLLLNLLLLLVIVVIPYATSLVAEYLPDPHIKAAAVLYNGIFLLMALCFSALWKYAIRENRLLGDNADVESIEAISGQYRFGPLYYIAILILSLINAPLSLVVSLIFAIYFALPGLKLKKRARMSIPEKE